MTYRYNVIDSPFGPISPAVDENGAVAWIWFGAREPGPGRMIDAKATADVDRQLGEYFERKRQDFDLPLAPKGSEFQHDVWKLLREIPYGETRSYGQLAKELGKPDASRAVGRANATNPIAIIVPCHRVIGTNGTLTGYAGGLEMKDSLLKFERGLVSLFD